MSQVVEDRILDFIDGHLESHDEEELLHRLAVSPEKRGLLREHMKLRQTVHTASKTEQLAVPTDVTASLYRRLAYNGYAGASLGSAVAVTRPMVAATTGMMVKQAAPVIASGYKLSALLSFAVLSFILGAGFTTLLDRTTPSVQTAHRVAGSASGNTLSYGIHQAPVKTLENPRGEAPAERAYSAWQPVPFEQRQRIEVEPLMVYSGVAVASSVQQMEAAQPQPVLELQQPQINSSFFTDKEVELVERIPIRDLTFDTRAYTLSINGTKSHVARKSSPPILTTELDTREPAPVYKTAPANPVSEVDPVYPSLRGSIEGASVVPLEFRFGDFAKNPASTYFSFRSGGGRLPGSDLGISGSLHEFRLSYQVSDHFVLKGSVGEFTAYENTAYLQGDNGNGVALIGVRPEQTSRYVFGAEAAYKFNPFAIPMEVSAGGMLDEAGVFIPRGSLMSSISLSRDFSILLGLEAMLYSFDVQSSIGEKIVQMKGKNAAVRNGLPSRSLSGFIGPTIEFGYHF